MNNNLNFYKITFITIIIIILLMQIYVLFLLLLFYNLFIRTLEIYRSEDKSIMFVMCRSNKGWSVLCWRNGMHGEISFLSLILFPWHLPWPSYTTFFQWIPNFHEEKEEKHNSGIEFPQTEEIQEGPAENAVAQSSLALVLSRHLVQSVKSVFLRLKVLMLQGVYF